jgi:protein-disulfide isomerase-like protein with CxxC motif
VSNMATHHEPALRQLSADEALIALLVAAMETNHHASPEEAARAEGVLHEIPRLRRLSRIRRGEIIERMKTAVGDYGAAAVMAAASHWLPPALRSVAMTAIADVMLAHGLDRIESAALLDVAARFGFTPEDTAAAIDQARRRSFHASEPA